VEHYQFWIRRTAKRSFEVVVSTSRSVNLHSDIILGVVAANNVKIVYRIRDSMDIASRAGDNLQLLDFSNFFYIVFDTS